mgnify:CR=1 FL=1
MRNKIVTILLLTILLSTKLLYADNLVKRAQTYLTMSGFDIGKVDGIIGPKTVKGLRKVYNSSEIYKNYKISENLFFKAFKRGNSSKRLINDDQKESKGSLNG